MTLTTKTQHDNRVLIVGSLNPASVRGGRGRGENKEREIEMVRQIGNGIKRGARSLIRVQVNSPYGDSTYQLDLDLDHLTPGIKMLENATEGMPIVIEGHLGLVAEDDRNRRDDRGEARKIQNVKVVPTLVRKPTEGEVRSYGACWIKGTVMEPPQVRRHPDRRELRLAITRVKVAYHTSPSEDIPGVLQEDVITVAVPINDVAAAQKLYKPDNEVYVRGQLEMVVEEQRSSEAQAAVAALDEEWDAGADDRAAEKKLGAVRQQQRSYRITRENLRYRTRLMLLAGAVELLSGEEMTVQEAQQMARVFRRERRERREGQQQRRGQAIATSAGRREQRAAVEESEGAGATTANAPLIGRRRAMQQGEQAEVVVGNGNGEYVADGVEAVAEMPVLIVAGGEG